MAEQEHTFPLWAIQVSAHAPTSWPDELSDVLDELARIWDLALSEIVESILVNSVRARFGAERVHGLILQVDG